MQEQSSGRCCTARGSPANVGATWAWARPPRRNKYAKKFKSRGVMKNEKPFVTAVPDFDQRLQSSARTLVKSASTGIIETKLSHAPDSFMLQALPCLSSDSKTMIKWHQAYIPTILTPPQNIKNNAFLISRASLSTTTPTEQPLFLLREQSQPHRYKTHLKTNGQTHREKQKSQRIYVLPITARRENKCSSFRHALHASVSCRGDRSALLSLPAPHSSANCIRRRHRDASRI